MYKQFKTFVRKSLQRIGLFPVRSDFLRILPKNGIGAELGVFQGELSKELIKVAKPTKLHLIDPWWTVIGEQYGDWSRYHNDGELLTTKKAHSQTIAHVASVNGQEIAEIHIEDDIAVLERMSDDYLDWAYVDSTHLYDHTVKELAILNSKVKPNGMIAGHDWHPDPNHRHHGVYQAVNEFCAQENWEIIRIDKRYTQWAIKRKKH